MPKKEEPKAKPEEEPSEGEEEETPEDLLRRLKYLQAEFENYKKRVAREMEMFGEYSSQKFITMILPILDDLEKASNTIKDEKDASGVKMIYDNLMETLGGEGLEEIGAVGDDFDPFRHECVSQTRNKEMESNKIAEVIQKGYGYKSRVLRPTKVIVVKNEMKEEDNGEDNRDRSGDD